MKITVIIPALNEEECIGRLVGAIARPPVSEIIVVDNNSTDRTAEVARAAGATVISQSGRGYGAACMAGVRAGDADVLVFMDGDLSDDPAELPRMVAPVLSGEAALVLGNRVHVEPGAMTPQQIAGNRVALALIALIFHRRLHDLPSFKAVRRSALEELNLQERTYGWTTELVVKAVRAHLPIVEVPAAYHKRGGGQSKVAGTLRGTLGAGYSILRVVLRYAL